MGTHQRCAAQAANTLELHKIGLDLEKADLFPVLILFYPVATLGVP